MSESLNMKTPRVAVCLRSWVVCTPLSFCCRLMHRQLLRARESAAAAPLLQAGNIQQFTNYVDRNGLQSLATAPFVYRELCSKRCVSISINIKSDPTCVLYRRMHLPLLASRPQ